MENFELDEFLQTLLNPTQNFEESSSRMTIKELFDRRLKELAFSQSYVEKILNIERKSLDGILEKTAKRVDVINILKLANFLNLNSDFFLKIYLNEMPSELIGDLEIARKANFIVSNFDINSLFKVKFLKSKTDFSHIEDRLNQFFGLDNIYQFGNNKTFPAFSRTRRSSNNLMRDFWVKSAFTHFERINNPYDFDREALVELLPKIRPYTMNIDNGLFIVAQALYIVGVTVIFQPNLPSVQVRGATFLCNKKPCIVLTDYNKNYPTIWFALLHELCHVLYDLESLEKNVFHMTGEPDLFLVNEDFANDFAREYLFSSEKSSYIAPFINDKLIVSEYAKESQVHPSFVYNFYNYDQYLKGDSMAWSRYKEFFPDVSRAVKILNTNPWGKDSIDESAELLKENIFNLN